MQPCHPSSPHSSGSPEHCECVLHNTLIFFKNYLKTFFLNQADLVPVTQILKSHVFIEVIVEFAKCCQCLCFRP